MWSGPALMPGPGRCDHLLHATMSRTPAQVPAGQARICDQGRRIPGTPRSVNGWNTKAGHPLDGAYLLAHREALPVAEVENLACPSVQKTLQCQDMGICQIGHVDIVSDAGTIGGRLVVAKDGHLLSPPGRGVKHQRNEMGLGGRGAPRSDCRDRHPRH